MTEETYKMLRVRTIVPRKIVTSYLCATCKTKYKNSNSAEKCELKAVENKKFKLGDCVKGREKRFCQNKRKYYWMRGKIVKILGPTLPDEEYNHKWLGGELTGLHCFKYFVRWTCPHCKEIRDDGEFYSLELQKIKTR